MIPVKAARRYAAALLAYAIETGTLKDVLRDITFVDTTIAESRDLRLFLRNPVIKPEKKKEVIRELFHKSVSKPTKALFDLVAEKARFDILEGITKAFINAYRKHEGIVEAHVFYADEPDKKQLENIRAALEKRTGKKVELKTSQKPALVGGIVVKIDDTVIDGSVKHRLEKLEHLLFKAAI